MLIYNGQIIAGGGTIVLPMTRAEYEANKAILDSADVWVDLTDEPDQIAEANQVAFWVGQTQKSVGYIGDIATKAIAKVEPTDTALYLHEMGTYFINKDGNMCETDVQISVGGTIVLDANCHVVDGGISSNLDEPVFSSIDNAKTWYTTNAPTTTRFGRFGDSTILMFSPYDAYGGGSGQIIQFSVFDGYYIYKLQYGTWSKLLINTTVQA